MIPARARLLAFVAIVVVAIVAWNSFETPQPTVTSGSSEAVNQKRLTSVSTTDVGEVAVTQQQSMAATEVASKIESSPQQQQEESAPSAVNRQPLISSINNVPLAAMGPPPNLIHNMTKEIGAGTLDRLVGSDGDNANSLQLPASLPMPHLHRSLSSSGIQVKWESIPTAGGGKDAMRVELGTGVNEDNGVCRFGVKIRYSTPHRGGAKKISASSASYRHHVLNSIGPNAFRICLTSGPEVLCGTTTTTLDGDATTSAGGPKLVSLVSTTYVEVRSKGSYQMDIKWDLDEFRALDETFETITTFKNSYLVRGAKLNCAVAGDHLKGTATDKKKPNPCADGSHQGRLVVLSKAEQDTIAASVKAGGKGSSSTSKTNPSAYYPWRGNDLRFTPDVCSVGAFSLNPAQLDLCMKRWGETFEELSPQKKKAPGIFFTGDSQIRTLFRHWVAVASGTAPVVAKGGDIKLRFHNKQDEQQSTKDASTTSHYGRFIWDPYFHGLAGREEWIAQHYDVLVFGFGAWPASFGQWSMDMIAKRFEELQPMVGRLVKLGVKVIWVGSPAWPKHRKNVPGFRITNYRLAFYNSLGAQMFKRVGAQHLDWFQMTYPMPKLHRGDGMHYDRSVLMFSAVDMLATMLCGPFGVV